MLSVWPIKLAAQTKTDSIAERNFLCLHLCNHVDTHILIPFHCYTKILISMFILHVMYYYYHKSQVQEPWRVFFCLFVFVFVFLLYFTVDRSYWAVMSGFCVESLWLFISDFLDSYSSFWITMNSAVMLGLAVAQWELGLFASVSI